MVGSAVGVGRAHRVGLGVDIPAAAIIAASTFYLLEALGMP